MTKNVLKTIRLTSSALAITLGLCMAQGAFAEGKTYHFDIPAESTAKALTDFSRQADVQILFPYEVVANRSSGAISGDYDRGTVLRRLLEGSGLEIAHESDRVITLRVAGPMEKTSSASDPNAPAEIVVTGTHIRGAAPTSPLHTVTRKDIDQSGYSQIGDLMRSLPENFSGGQNPGVFAATYKNAANSNASNASTVNLHGLGSDATLVLLNGHRLSGDYVFQGGDISGVPLSAVQRIEVVPDGASALYGADAVAGVVNMILRKNYNGGEISARIGGTAEGGGGERTYSALGGVARDNWFLLANLEYSEQDAITAGQRAFTSEMTPASTLMQPNRRRSIFVSAGGQIGDRLNVTFDGLVHDRVSTSVTELYYGKYTTSQYTPAYSAALSADLDLTNTWKLHVTGVASGSHNNLSTLFFGVDYPSDYRNSVQYVEATVDGRLVTLPSGDVKVALGGGYRRDGFIQGYADSNSTYVNAVRKVGYVYAEALVPLVAPSTSRTGLHELEISLSGRAEHYSDFGDTKNPKIGVRYVPLTNLTLRGTWGKSFKAPAFIQMYQDYQLVLFDARDTGYTGGGPNDRMLLTNGGNPELKPETSTSWTFGGDYTPAGFNNLTLSATYFDIDYKGRVVQPINPLSQSLGGNPMFEPFIQRNPTTAQQADVFGKADYFDNYSSGPYDPAQVVAIVFDTYQNATSQTVNGFDLAYRQTFNLPICTLNAFYNATWLRLEQSTVASLPNLRLSGRIMNVPDFKGRGGLSLQHHGFTATALVNYVAGEVDDGVIPSVPIASWTTVDATLAYHFEADSGFRRNLKISVSASNLFDKMPPRVVSPAILYPGLYFDSTNTSIVGRFVSLTVTKGW
jgi:iron complex outermembrane receptor protein